MSAEHTHEKTELNEKRAANEKCLRLPLSACSLPRSHLPASSISSPRKSSHAVCGTPRRRPNLSSPRRSCCTPTDRTSAAKIIEPPSVSLAFIKPVFASPLSLYSDRPHICRQDHEAEPNSEITPLPRSVQVAACLACSSVPPVLIWSVKPASFPLRVSQSGYGRVLPLASLDLLCARRLRSEALARRAASPQVWKKSQPGFLNSIVDRSPPSRTPGRIEPTKASTPSATSPPPRSAGTSCVKTKPIRSAPSTPFSAIFISALPSRRRPPTSLLKPGKRVRRRIAHR